MKMYQISFSPTGGTKKAADILTGALNGETEVIDLTNAHGDFGSVALTKEDIAVIAVPSYGGRVPGTATERLAKVHGNGARAVLVCVYGNRAYEDTLVEMLDTAKQAGFNVIAAVAAIAEHSIARQFAAAARMPKTVRYSLDLQPRFRQRLPLGIPANLLFPATVPIKSQAASEWFPKLPENVSGVVSARRNVRLGRLMRRTPKRWTAMSVFPVCGAFRSARILHGRSIRS